MTHGLQIRASGQLQSVRMVKNFYVNFSVPMTWLLDDQFLGAVGEADEVHAGGQVGDAG